jgi:hypothetical protein
MRSKQHGVTFIGWLFLLLPLAIICYAAIRLVPKYLVYTEVSRSMTQVANEFKDDPQVSVTALRVSLEKHFDIESIDFPAAKDVSFTREDGIWVAEINYQDGVPLFAGIALTVDFSKRVPFK